MTQSPPSGIDDLPVLRYEMANDSDGVPHITLHLNNEGDSPTDPNQVLIPMVDDNVNILTLPPFNPFLQYILAVGFGHQVSPDRYGLTRSGHCHSLDSTGVPIPYIDLGISLLSSIRHALANLLGVEEAWLQRQWDSQCRIGDGSSPSTDLEATHSESNATKAIEVYLKFKSLFLTVANDAGLTLARNPFAWATLPNILSNKGFRLSGYPISIPFPGEEPPPAGAGPSSAPVYCGLQSLCLSHLDRLMDQLASGDLYFEIMNPTECDQAKAGLEPVIVNAPATSASDRRRCQFATGVVKDYNDDSLPSADARKRKGKDCLDNAPSERKRPRTHPVRQILSPERNSGRSELPTTFEPATSSVMQSLTEELPSASVTPHTVLAPSSPHPAGSVTNALPTTSPSRHPTKELPPSAAQSLTEELPTTSVTSKPVLVPSPLVSSPLQPAASRHTTSFEPLAASSVPILLASPAASAAHLTTTSAPFPSSACLPLATLDVPASDQTQPRPAASAPTGPIPVASDTRDRGLRQPPHAQRRYGSQQFADDDIYAGPSRPLPPPYYTGGPPHGRPHDVRGMGHLRYDYGQRSHWYPDDEYYRDPRGLDMDRGYYRDHRPPYHFSSYDRFSGHRAYPRPFSHSPRPTSPVNIPRYSTHQLSPRNNDPHHGREDGEVPPP